MVRTKHTTTPYKSNGGINEIYSNDNYQTTKKQSIQGQQCNTRKKSKRDYLDFNFC